MLVFNRGKIFSSIFTVAKLSAALVLLFVLATKFVDLWQDTAAETDIQQTTQELLR
ncbi:MAG: hypothetical protein AAFR42_14760 [Cyanobacteria bacterium J06628_6]